MPEVDPVPDALVEDFRSHSSPDYGRRGCWELLWPLIGSQASSLLQEGSKMVGKDVQAQ